MKGHRTIFRKITPYLEQGLLFWLKKFKRKKKEKSSKAKEDEEDGKRTRAKRD